MDERHPLVRAKRQAGRAKRALKRRLRERRIGREYRAWLADSQQREPGSVENAVPIAVVVPVFDPPIAFLEACVASVRNQTARNWQLILSDDGSTNPEIIAALERIEAQARHDHDERIIVVRSSNGGIATACNRGLERVTTRYFGWLDHDDELNARAIELFSEAIAERARRGRSTLVVYSDEDKIDPQGRHFELACKPGFSPELLLSQMYLCHFTAFDTDVVRALGGFRSIMDGAQDFDLALRLLPQLDEANVEHVAKPLYHWRAWSGSTALTIEAKPWAQEAAARAQREHLERTTGGGTVVPSRVRGLNEVHPRMKPTIVSVIVPTIGIADARGARLVERAIASLRQLETQADMEVITVTTGELASIPGADRQVVYEAGPAGFNFAEAINLGRAHAAGEYLLLLNDDTEAAVDDPVTRLLELGQLDGVGAVGAMLTYPDGRLQHVGIVLLPSGPTHPFIGKPGGDYGYFGSTLTPRNYSSVTAAVMLTRVSAFDAVGGFDTGFARDFNDVDYCLRLREAGHRIAWTPYARFLHREGASIVRRHADAREASAFTERWRAYLDADPYYSPALEARLDRLYEER